jgi:hypothetical protein
MTGVLPSTASAVLATLFGSCKTLTRLFRVMASMVAYTTLKSAARSKRLRLTGWNTM